MYMYYNINSIGFDFHIVGNGLSSLTCSIVEFYISLVQQFDCHFVVIHIVVFKNLRNCLPKRDDWI